MAIDIRTFTGEIQLDGTGCAEFSTKISGALKRGLVPTEPLQVMFNEQSGAYDLALTCASSFSDDIYEGFEGTSDLPDKPSFAKARYEVVLNSGDRSHCEDLEKRLNTGWVLASRPRLVPNPEGKSLMLTSYMIGVHSEDLEEASEAFAVKAPFDGRHI